MTARNYTRHPPTFAELTEACQRAYSTTGDGEYLKAIDGIQEARIKRQMDIYAIGGSEDADDVQPPPDLRLSSWAGTAWQRYREDIRRRPAQPQRSGFSRRDKAVIGAALALLLLWNQLVVPLIAHIF